ncbi:unnamed protein product [Symbiodinium natans]|uniref:Uncharacterized protein n=1 Tax=Symbiodinium natans TaxID=878477 RepID=A0A812JRP5_9DINO|nr:unnamed protein product [Symbiodinium natans]
MTLPQAAETAPSGEECAAAVCSEHHVLRVMLTALRPTDAGGLAAASQRFGETWCAVPSYGMASARVIQLRRVTWSRDQPAFLALRAPATRATSTAAPRDLAHATVAVQFWSASGQ